jgi:succinate dehydrogenase assembly factor 1
MPPSRLVRHSGMQKTVLSLYRQSLQAAARLPSEEARASARDLVRREYREKASTVDKMDFQRVEHLIRHAKKKLELFAMPGVTSVGAAALR